MRPQPAAASTRLSAGDVARFTTITALIAIFSDAAVGHGLTWENDPYTFTSSFTTNCFSYCGT